MAQQKSVLTWIGWGLTLLAGLGMIGSAAGKFSMSPEDRQKMFVEHGGYPDNTLIPIAIAELVAAILFLFPRTAVLGAVVLTGYLGGAVATHVRLGENIAAPVIGGVLVWLALYFRDSRIRALMPLYSKPVETTA
jgi:hypothetical protein